MDPANWIEDVKPIREKVNAYFQSVQSGSTQAQWGEVDNLLDDWSPYYSAYNTALQTADASQRQSMIQMFDEIDEKLEELFNLARPGVNEQGQQLGGRRGRKAHSKSRKARKSRKGRKASRKQKKTRRAIQYL